MSDHQKQSTKLDVEVGCASIAGVKPVNEDAVQAYIPITEHALINKGVSVVIADGVSSAEAGRQASQFSVATFIEEYFRTPDTWSVKQSGQKTLSAINLNLFKKSHAFVQQEKGFLCTFSGVVIKSCTAYFFHAGDSRLYRFRKGEISQLTRDHTVNIGKGKNILSRAVGMDNVLQIDYGKSDLASGDLLLLTTDGVHDFLTDEQLQLALSSEATPQEICDGLIQQAQNAKSDDNISCAIAHIKTLPEESRDDFNFKLTRLPFPPDLEPGMKLDGYRIEKELFASSRSHVYLVTDTQPNQQMVMKTT
ncbi:protein phosphatase 2C domain-containing protein, partial [uncultured Paraglaciecola sp.]|uniref:PP2C family protein-serine/threonine phosphatase n=1 Tax=uncultured Paraglaciecola sp. TaxID=1765024 RepID=UPI0025F74BBB